ncbi:MAG: PQQ-binding-like beta-propeller repeat protein, partial [Myxococcales bacterium]|nr:PQQ-binding-like beta-propeller repeat protein [Myxococcales bacterium]
VQPGVFLWGIDSRRGRVEWTKKLPGVMGYVRGNSDGAYYVSDNGSVLKLSPDRGEFRWQIRLEGRVLTPPILKRGLLYVSTERRKSGWTGSGIYCIDVAKGKLLWKTKIASARVSKFLRGKDLGVIDDRGKLVVFDKDSGKKVVDLKLPFGAPPRSLHGAAVGNRAFVFTNDVDNNGFMWLVDLEKKRLIATANALDAPVASMTPAAKMVFLDGADGSLYAYRLDRSQRPKRRSVPPEEHARELIARARRVRGPLDGLAIKLAGLGKKALGATEGALSEAHANIVQAAAKAIAMLQSRRSAAVLMRALKARLASPPSEDIDPVISIVDALAEIRATRAVKPLTALMKDETQVHTRRRAAYVALGAIGTGAALSPIWAFRATKQVNTLRWAPSPYTLSNKFMVDEDVTNDVPPEDLKRTTTRTVQNKAGQTYTAALSPYLGGYNDVWVGKSDLAGTLERPIFTGLTKAELVPGRRIKIGKVSVGKRDLTLQISMRSGKKWVRSRPVKLSLAQLLKDRDGDGLSDIVERRLRLCVTHPDCDGDGVKDSEDVNPLASSKIKLTRDMRLFREAFFAFYGFIKRRGIVVVDPGDGPSFELYGRQDPILSLRRSSIERLRKEAGLHAADFVSFGGPYPEGSGSGDALPKVVYDAKSRTARIGMDIVRSGNNGVGYNVWLKQQGKNWIVTNMKRVWRAVPDPEDLPKSLSPKKGPGAAAKGTAQR